jgi:radical SAM superfamily enzyme YgiQ (UPF0313 family)
MIFTQENPPIGLGYLASYLGQFGFHVTILDLTVRRITFRTLLEFIVKKHPIFIGITALTPYYNDAKVLAQQIKRELPSTPLVLGGVHMSSLPELALEECEADFVVIGEGEETTLELAQVLADHQEDYSKIKGIGYRKNSQVRINEPRGLIADLDALPLPAWHKIDPNKYPRAPHGSTMKFKEVAPILSSRGCPFSCDYCASCRFWGQKIRYRSPAKVVDEMEYLIDNFGIKEFHIWDDNLTLKRSHIEGICREILNRHLKIALAMPNGVRVDTLDREILSLMRQAGFYFLIFAIESWSQRILNENNKRTNLKIILRNITIGKKLGFELGCFLIFGFENDTVETIQKSIRFTKSLPFDQVAFFTLKPLPGSKTFARWADGRDLKDFDWNHINFFNSRVVVSHMDPLLLEKWQRRAYTEFYLRLPILIRAIFYRFVKRGHAFQLKFLLEKLKLVLFGFDT